MDRAVEDVDPLAVSLRNVERPYRDDYTMTREHFPGSPYGAANEVYVDPATGTSGRTRPYKLDGMGFTAWLDRPLYMVRKDKWEDGEKTDYDPRIDGEWISLLPANTVFDLDPTPVMTPEQVMRMSADKNYAPGQTNEQIGNIAGTNPYYIPRNSQQTGSQAEDARITAQPVDTRVDGSTPFSNVEMSSQNPRLQYEMQSQMQQEQMDQVKVFLARREQWLKMKRELAAERRAERQAELDDLQAPDRLEDMRSRLEQQLQNIREQSEAAHQKAKAETAEGSARFKEMPKK